MRHLLAPLTKAVLRKHYADLALMEDMLRESGLDWTVVRPPRLTDKPGTGNYRTAFGQNLRRGVDDRPGRRRAVHVAHPRAAGDDQGNRRHRQLITRAASSEDRGR